ncbi:hypothetical protein ACERK3_12940 [Phycisphaerales bacterium AB-hyl4]|uniref:Transposase n=1 Tax=Natronomicrosphaera hydrolytica TaxID=3242702 RepID=A0ABV4U6H0_9BACT
MSMHAGRAKLHEAFKQLTRRWQQTQRDWQDPASRAFEQKYLTPLESDVRTVSTAMARMSESLQRARRDCDCD